jgi:hypothetical protein
MAEVKMTEPGFSKDFDSEAGIRWGGKEMGPVVPHVGLSY